MPHRVAYNHACCGRRATARTDEQRRQTWQQTNKPCELTDATCNERVQRSLLTPVSRASVTARSAGSHWAAPGSTGRQSVGCERSKAQRRAAAYSAAPAGAARRGCMLHVALCGTCRRCSPWLHVACCTLRHRPALLAVVACCMLHVALCGTGRRCSPWLHVACCTLRYRPALLAVVACCMLHSAVPAGAARRWTHASQTAAPAKAYVNRNGRSTGRAVRKDH
jgi:hypothetical protein